MTMLITLLESVHGQSSEDLRPALDEAISEARDLANQNQTLQTEVKRLEQILRDIRERDARKNCLCRGMG